MSRIPLLAVLALAACAGGNPLRGRYVGVLVPQAGPACDVHGTSVLIVGPKTFTFTPNSGVLNVDGPDPAPGAPLAGALVLPGMAHKPFPITFRATSRPDGGFDGVLESPDCRSTIVLRRG